VRVRIRCSVIDSVGVAPGSGKATAIRSRQPPAIANPGNSQTIGPTRVAGSHCSRGASSRSATGRSAKALRWCQPKESQAAVLLRLVLNTVLVCSEAKW
jgi:hypothetical protein